MMYVYGPCYFLGWGSLALINTAIAQLQGRNPLLWLFLSFLFGPLATIFLIATYQQRI